MIELLVIYLIVGALLVGSVSKKIKIRMPFTTMAILCIFWFPIMFICVCTAARKIVARKRVIDELKKEMRKDVWKNQ